MGSMIHLYVGNLAVDWGKNRGFTDHSPFFQTTDVTTVPYYYAADGSDYVDDKGQTQWKTNIVLKEGLSKPLSLVKDRIELLGHTIEHCREEFMQLAGLNDFDSAVFEFDALREALATVDVSSISLLQPANSPLEPCRSVAWRTLTAYSVNIGSASASKAAH